MLLGSSKSNITTLLVEIYATCVLIEVVDSDMVQEVFGRINSEFAQLFLEPECWGGVFDGCARASNSKVPRDNVFGFVPRTGS
jgi:hypothetical protein